MAYDKVIDSAALDAGMTATANAIREKTGQAGAIPWENDKGFSAAVAGIQVGGGSGGETFPQKLYETDIVLDATITNAVYTDVCTVSTGLKDRTYLNNGEILLATFTCTPADISYAYHKKLVQYIAVYQGVWNCPTPMFSIMNTNGTSGLYDKYVSTEGLSIYKVTADLSTLTLRARRGSAYPVAGTYHLEFYRTGVTY